MNRRLWKRIVRDGDCWVWTGAKNDQGYGQVVIDGQRAYTHRLVYELLVGPIPDGLEIDHLCRNTSCCRPAHLEPVTHAENIRRGYEAKAQTHCKRGHHLAVTARLTKDGRRDCRECERVRVADPARREHRLALRRAAHARRQATPGKVSVVITDVAEAAA